jgi:hypothetical protein
MDCNHARLLLTFARDNAELDQSEADRLSEHLRRCPECASMSAAQRRFDLGVERAMRDVPAPPGLKTRILARLAGRRWRRWVVGGAAVAASLLLAIGITWHIVKPLPDIDVRDLPILVCTDGPSPEQVRQWFRDQDIGMALPPFKHELLESCVIAEFQGQRVALLNYHFRGNQEHSTAHVYVLSPSHFNADSEVPSSLRVLPARTVDIIHHEGYLFVVVYGGSSLEPFRKAN